MNKVYNNNTPWELIAKTLSGNASAQENKDLEKWIAEKPDHQLVFDETKLIWEQSSAGTAVSADQLKTEEAWKKLQQRIGSVKKGRSVFLRNWQFSAAASVAVLLFVSYWLYPQIGKLMGAGNDKANWLAVTNSTPEPKTVQMPDGSTIVLNKNSTLRYPDKFDERSVELQGEAYFKVVYNPKKPFKVNAGDADIEVLGTAFNVRRNAQTKDVAVMVESGKVNFVAAGNQPMLLLAGKGAVYNASAKKIEPKINSNASAWNSKHFKFQNTPVSEIISSLQDVYGLSVKVSNDKLLSCEFNGVFDKVAPENILHALSFSMGAELIFENGVYTLKGEGCNH